MTSTMSPYLGEAIGTAILILLGDGVVAGVLLKRSKAENAGWIVISIAWGLAVLMGIYVSGPISGAHLNPALTIALALAGSFPWDMVPGYIICQFIGAFVGATLVWLAYLPHWEQTEDKAAKLGIFCTIPAILDKPKNLITEIIGTFVLVLVIMAMGINQMVAGVGPLAVASLIIVIGMSLGGPTGYAINPARDLGPRIMHALLPIAGKGSSDWGYAWVPVIGPIIGGALAALFFKCLY